MTKKEKPLGVVVALLGDKPENLVLAKEYLAKIEGEKKECWLLPLHGEIFSALKKFEEDCSKIILITEENFRGNIRSNIKLIKSSFPKVEIVIIPPPD